MKNAELAKNNLSRLASTGQTEAEIRREIATRNHKRAKKKKTKTGSRAETEPEIRN